MDDLVNLYFDGLPWCRANYPRDIYEDARKDGINLSCTMYREAAEEAVSWLLDRGYMAYYREGEFREDLCEPMVVDDEYDPNYDMEDRWYPNDDPVPSWYKEKVNDI
jgi:hypothetical protein